MAAKTRSSYKKVRVQRHTGKKEKVPLGGGLNYRNLKPKTGVGTLPGTITSLLALFNENYVRRPSPRLTHHCLITAPD